MLTGKTIVLALSGGMDSATLLGELLHQKARVHPVIFRYGSKHNPWENSAAVRIATHYQLIPEIINLTDAFRSFKSNLLTSGGEIPEGHYAAESMRKTVVPGRNTIFIAFMLGYAQSIGASGIGLGVHAGDHHIYPDCRAAYIQAAQKLVSLASEERIDILAPYLYMDKADILSRGVPIGVPYHLTRTCYKAQSKSCGRCGSCTERLEAFHKIGHQDPIEYEE